MTTRTRFRALVFAFGLVVVGLALPIAFTPVGKTNPQTARSSDVAETAYVPHDPMVISSDQDFIEQGWSGLGSILDPFILEGYEFDTLLDGSCVLINNTQAWFVLRDCLFSHTELSFGGSVALLNVSRGTVALCIFEQGTTSVMAQNCNMMRLELLDCTGGAILCYGCQNSTIDRCEISHVTSEGAGTGIVMYDCTMDVTGNTVEYAPQWGVYMYNCHDCQVGDNTFQYSWLVELYLATDCSYNTIYDNHLIRSSTSTCAEDDGQSNAWDAGPGHGNWWSDYDGFGYYYVPGSAQSIDHYPEGPAVTTTTSTTTTSTTMVVSSFGLDFWTPMAVPERIVLVTLVITSAVLTAAAVLVLLRKGKFV